MVKLMLSLTDFLNIPVHLFDKDFIDNIIHK